MAEDSGPNEQQVKDFVFRKEDLVPISRDEFIPGSILPADVFLRLNDDKFVRIAKEGSKSQFHEMHFSENQKVDEFYVRRNEYFRCVGQNITVAGILVTKAEISDIKKISFLAKTAETVFKEIEHLGFNHESMGHAKSVTQSIRTLVDSRSDLSSLVGVMQKINSEVIRHSMAVSAISVMIAKNLGWVIPTTLEKLALGALLHDIGLKEISRDLIEKPRHEMTNDERAQYESHCFRGAEVLRTMPSVPDDVISIAYEHHENSLGQGYPRKIKDTKMNPLAKVVAAADFFAELSFQSPSSPGTKSPADAMKYIETTLGQPFNKPIFQALQMSLTKVNQGGTVKLIA